MTAEQLEAYLERAAILEFEAGMPRNEAELYAKSLILNGVRKKVQKNEKNAFLLSKNEDN